MERIQDILEKRDFGGKEEPRNQQLQMEERDLIWKDEVHLHTNTKVCVSSARE